MPITGNFVETVLASSAPGMPRTIDLGRMKLMRNRLDIGAKTFQIAE